MIDPETHMMECIKDGKVIWRTIDYVQMPGEHLELGGPMPVLYDGEKIMNIVGSSMPHIVQGQFTDWIRERLDDFDNKPFPEEF